MQGAEEVLPVNRILVQERTLKYLSGQRAAAGLGGTGPEDDDGSFTHVGSLALGQNDG